MQTLAGERPDIVAHRFVHGGEVVDAARLVNAAERTRLDGIVDLAPLHLPGNLMGLDLCRQYFAVPQIACFDSAFHATMPDLASRLPIPQALGLRRFGFHGINYAYVASRLADTLGDLARGKVVVAHLGSGASLCLLENLKSTDTTMGYSPAGGIPMATRAGDLDPGVMLELAKRFNHEQLSNMVYQKMGLLALSDGESNEMRALVASNSAQAKFAVSYFCRQVRAAIGSLAAKAGGIDALVFTGGIGEHSAEIRAEICAPLDFIGISLSEEANKTHATSISCQNSKPVLVIPADEEIMMHRLCLTFL